MRVAIVGCGHVSDQYFVGCRRHEVLELVACADLDLNRAEQKAAEHSVPRACSPEELMGDPDINLVVNLAPLAHADASLAASRPASTPARPRWRRRRAGAQRRGPAGRRAAGCAPTVPGGGRRLYPALPGASPGPTAWDGIIARTS